MMYPVFEDEYGTLQGFRTTHAEWVPYYDGDGCVEENPPRDKTMVFDLKEPFAIMKHYTTTGRMEKKGFMIWIESCKWDDR